MKTRNDDSVLEFFKEVLRVEINSAVYFYKSDIKGMSDEKRRKFKKKAYSEEQYKALEWIVTLKEKEQKNIETLLQFYTSDSFRYFFKRLEEGENIEQGERINFDLTAVNEKTGEKTKLISATPDEDNIDNNFQEWIMENCNEIK